MAEDYYKTLGLGRNASQSDIEKAYRKMATKFHPDLHPDDRTAKEKFQKVQQAYDVLNDAEKRELYDRYGSAFESMGGGGPQWRTAQGGQGSPDIDFNSVFGQGGGGVDIEELLRKFSGAGGAAGGGGGRRGRRPRAAARGADLEAEILVPFRTAINGGQAQLSVRRPSGQVETIELKIPPGITEGKQIRVRGQGEPSPTGGPPGDILVAVRVAKHPFFQRTGDDLEVSVPLTLAEAALGATVDVPTPQGTIALKVPAGTASGKRLRIKGHGVLKANTRGDLYAEIQIVLPAKLDAEAQDQIRNLDRRYPLNPRAGLQW